MIVDLTTARGLCWRLAFCPTSIAVAPKALGATASQSAFVLVILAILGALRNLASTIASKDQVQISKLMPKIALLNGVYIGRLELMGWQKRRE